MEDVESVTGLATQATENHADNDSRKSYQENLVNLRKKSELLEQQNLLLQQQLMQQAQQRQQPQEVEEAFDFSMLEREEFPDGKNLAKAFKSVERKLKSYDQKLTEKDRKINLLETAVQYKDFAEVVTPENIKKYIESDEDNLEAVRTASNPGRRLYNLIKKNADYQHSLEKKAPTHEQRKVEEKESKPKTGSVGVRSEAVGVAAQLSSSRMTKEQKAALWRETLSYAAR